MFAASILGPTLLGGFRLAILSPDLIFGSGTFDSKISTVFYSILTFLLSPFHATILHFKEYYVQFQLRSNPDDEMLTSYRDRLRNHSFQFVKLELGLETVLQFIGQLILYFLAQTKTQTVGEIQKIEVDETLLVISLIASFIGCLLSYLKGLSKNREHFPFMSKVMAVCFITPALMARVLCIIMYFTPALGLHDVLLHWKNEQISWNTDILKDFIDHDDLIGDNIELRQDDTVIKVSWKEINRATTSLKGPEYILYTTLKLKEYFWIFLILFLINAAIISHIKYLFSIPFKRYTFLERAIHALENVLLPYNSMEWDSEKGNPEEHKKRMETNRDEMYGLVIVNFIFNCILMVPMCILSKCNYCLYEYLLIVTSKLIYI